MSDYESVSAITTRCLHAADSAERWGVAFARRGDRLAHVLFVDTPEGRQIFARSLEGTDTQDWPASPPLQQLDACPRSDERRGLVGLGAAGTSCWSLAVESDAQGGLSFDVACRAKIPPAFVGSSYELVVPTTHGERSETGLTCDLPDGRKWLLQGGQRDGAVHCQIDAPLVVIQPVTIPHTWPATIRWKYRLVCTGGESRWR